VIATWGAALFGLVSALLPAALIERLIAASGIPALIPAAGRPLSFETHIAISLLAAMIGGWLGLMLARRIAVAQYNAFPSSSNRMARITRQVPIAAAGGSLGGAGFDSLASGEAANLAFIPPGEPYHRAQPRFNLSSEPISIWGDAPPAAMPGTYGPELPELLLSEELEVGDEPEWQDITAPVDAEECFFDAYVDWPSESPGAPEFAPGEPHDASLGAASLDADEEYPGPDLFNIPPPNGASELTAPASEMEQAAWTDEVHAAQEDTDIPSGEALEPGFEDGSHFEAESEFVQPEDAQFDAESIADDAVEAQAASEVEPEIDLSAESPADGSEPYILPVAGGLHRPFDIATQPPSFEAEDDAPVLPSNGEEIGQHAREAEWPSTSPSISADLDSFGEPEEEDDLWPAADTGDAVEDWNEPDEFGMDEEAEEDASSLDTTLGAFRDYARDYTGGDDGEEEEEEEEEDDSNSSFGSLLGMTVRRRAADEPIELVGFDGEPVALSDCEIQFPDELESDQEFESPLLVRRRMGGA
jgi:hypothetical protein